MEESYEVWFDPTSGQSILMRSCQVEEFLLQAPPDVKQIAAFKANSDEDAQTISESIVNRKTDDGTLGC